ncbi:MAG: cation:proton antiporter [Hyphomonas sp.]
MDLPITDPVLIFAIVAGLILLAPIILGRWRLPGMIGLLIAGALLGPNGIGLLARDTAFVLFGTVGLLYIMFTAALEVDLAVLNKSKGHTLVFGLLTFAVPMTLGLVAARYILGFDWMPSALLASTFASHTLLTYPIASRLGITRNPAVTTAVGGTIITDTLALLVLAVVAAMARGQVGDNFWTQLFLGLTAYVAGVLILLPIIARWFFRNIARDGVSEFVFVLAVVFAISAAASYAGSEPIIGAFLAGLALNRLIPHNGILMNRINFTGEALFIPFFLLSVGMLLDLRIFIGGLQAWLVALTMVTTVIASKWLAAHAASRLLGYNTNQAQVIFGLSVPQAAATLAATMVGFQLGLFDETVVNGAIMMIFVTCILAPVVVQRFGRAMAFAEEAVQEKVDVYTPQRILVAAANDAPGHRLVDLAIMLKQPGSPQPVRPVRVLSNVNLDPAIEAAARRDLEAVTSHFSGAEIAAEPRIVRAVNVGSGLMKAVQDTAATDLIIGWPESGTTHELLRGSLINQLLGQAHVNLFVSRLRDSMETFSRLLIVLPQHAEHEEGFHDAMLTLKHLATQIGAQVHVVTTKEAIPALTTYFEDGTIFEDVKFHPLAKWAKLVLSLPKLVNDGDLVLLYSVRRGGLAWSPGDSAVPSRLVQAMPKANLLICYPAEPERLGEEGPSLVPGTLVPSQPAR